VAIRPIVVVPHEALSRKALEIIEIDDRVRCLALDMADTMYRVPGLGLAANQVGELLQLIVIDVVYPYAEPHEKKRNPLFILNPRIAFCEGSSVKEEGCLSVPEFGIEIKRSECVQVLGLDLEGKPLKVETDGLLARVLQHEIDHLKGTTLLDHASSLKRNLYRRRIKKKERKER